MSCIFILQHYSFYDFIVNKARGKSGPLFSFDVHEDVRVISDASVEKDEVSYLHITVWFRMDACELGLLFQCDFERFRSPWPIALSPRPVVEKRGPADEDYRREGDANIKCGFLHNQRVFLTNPIVHVRTPPSLISILFNLFFLSIVTCWESCSPFMVREK